VEYKLNSSTADGKAAVQHVMSLGLLGEYGIKTRPAGDVNCDGVDDFIIAITGLIGGSSESQIVQNFIVYGKCKASDWVSTPHVNLTTLSTSNGFSIPDAFFQASTVGAAGDLDQDGCGEYFIGVTLYPNGCAYLFPGNQNDGSPKSILCDTTTYYSSTERMFGYMASGDINHDSFPDLLFSNDITGGVPNHHKEIFCLLGNGSLTLAKIDFDSNSSKLIDVYAYPINVNDIAQKGYTFQTFDVVGDVNGDSYDDVVVLPWSGRAMLVLGSSTPSVRNIYGPAFPPVDYHHWKVSRAGDYDGDGKKDLFLASHDSGVLDRTNCGQAVVVFSCYNAMGTSDLDISDLLNRPDTLTIVGAQVNSYLGFSLNTAGDFNGEFGFFF